MAGRKRKLPSSFVPEPWLSEEEDGQWVENERLRHVPQVPVHLLRHKRQKRVNNSSEENEGEHEHEVTPVPQPLEQQRHVDEHADKYQQAEINQEEGDQWEAQPEEDEQQSDHDGQPEGLHQQEELEIDISDDQFTEEEVEVDIEDEDNVEQAVNIDGQEQTQDDDEDGDEVEEGETYKALYSKLSKDWLLTEIDHRVSKTASNEFWLIAQKYFHDLDVAKEREGRRKKTPQYLQARKDLYKAHVPSISLQIMYRHNQTGETYLIRGDSTPASQYPPNIYSKICEVASIEVIIFVRVAACYSTRNYA